MSKRTAKTGRARQGAPYQVGYGKPPAATQFKAGNTAARGRRKEREPFDTVLERVLHRRVPVNLKGKPHQMELVEAVITIATTRALQGELPYMKFILDLYQGRGLAGQPRSAQEELEREWGDVRERLRQKLKKRIAADKAAGLREKKSENT